MTECGALDSHRIEAVCLALLLWFSVIHLVFIALILLFLTVLEIWPCRLNLPQILPVIYLQDVRIYQNMNSISICFTTDLQNFLMKSNNNIKKCYDERIFNRTTNQVKEVMNEWMVVAEDLDLRSSHNFPLKFSLIFKICLVQFLHKQIVKKENKTNWITYKDAMQWRIQLQVRFVLILPSHK